MKFRSIVLFELLALLVFPSFTNSANATPQSAESSQMDNNRWIAYLDKENSVSVMHPNGSGKTKISEDLAVLPEIRWSSSGRYLSFVSGSTPFSFITNPYSLWVWDSQTNQVVLIQDTDVYVNYAWAPTDDILAYILVASEANPSTFPIKSTYSLSLLYMATGEQQTILPEMKGSFGWLPDGKRIAFEPYWEEKLSSCSTYYCDDWVEYSGIHTIDIQTGEISTLIEPREKPLTGIQISPQGSFVSFEEVRYFDGPGCAFPPMTTSITDSGAWRQLPYSYCVWSPNETKLACNSGGCGISGEPVSIYDGSYQLLKEIPQISSHLSDAPPGGTLLWTPDSKLLAMGVGYWVTPPVRKATLIVDTESWDTLADLQGVAFGWSPDGNYLLLNNQAESDEGLLGIFEVISQEFQSLGVRSVKNAVWQPRGLLEAPVNVSIRPDAGKQTYIIEWDALKDTNVTYEVRYAFQEITDSTWNGIDSYELHGDAQVENSRIKLPVTIENAGEGLSTSKIFIGVRAVNENGASSPVSHSPWIVDWGFRPDINGYEFGNSDANIWRNETVAPINDFTEADMIAMFGEEAVCVQDNVPACILTNEADAAYIAWIYWLGKGHCYGMATTSAKFFQGDASIFDGAASNGRLFGLTIDQARRPIAYYHVQQFTNPVTDRLVQDKDLTLQDEMEQLTALLEKGEGAVIALYFPDGNGGHAVAPLAVEQVSNELYRIWVYDNNYPAFRKRPSIRSIAVNVGQNSWNYLYEEGNSDPSKQYIEGVGSTYFFVVPLNLHSLHPEFIGANENPPRYAVQAPVGEGAVHLTIADEAGQIIGYDQDAFVNQIEGADIQPVFTTLNSWAEPVYWLPARSTYTVQITPISPEPVKDTLLSWIGDRFTIMASRDTLSKAEELNVTDSGKGLVYRFKDPGPVSLSFSQAEAEYETRLELQHYPFQAGDQLQIVYDQNTGDYLLTYSGQAEISGSLTVTLHNAQGENVIQKEDFQLQPDCIHHVQIENWSEQGVVRLGMDQNSDGQVDKWITERGTKGLFLANQGLLWGGVLILIGGFALIVGFVLLRLKRSTQR